MYIILLGAPGSGKGTQSKFITKKYKIPQISTGDILRENIKKNNNIGKKIFNILNNGDLVSDDIVCRLVYKRIKQDDCSKGFLLDGFPRTIQQAKYISYLGIKINFVLEFIVPDELILKRISGRRIHIKSGRTYHVYFNPPKKQGVDDITQEKLTIREDDKLESVKKRLKNYKKEINQLNQYYLKEQKNQNLKFFKIDGTTTPKNIQNKIKIILKNNKN
ncbi:Adenylate kinase [Buchnera aphidicola (Protaphis terricola)]|uniref:adenylate kinase n=1 Tax=Buchnera aphidicola TaxID=9 RepID=UPI003463F8A4